MNISTIQIQVKGKWENSEINSRQAVKVLNISQNAFLRRSHK